MTLKQNRPRIGDSCWFVEWCVKLGLVDDEHPEYGCNPDRNEMRQRRVNTREEAERLAREVYPLDAYGAVPFWPATFMPYDDDDAVIYPNVGFWEATADADHYEGE